MTQRGMPSDHNYRQVSPSFKLGQVSPSYAEVRRVSQEVESHWCRTLVFRQSRNSEHVKQKEHVEKQKSLTLFSESALRQVTPSFAKCCQALPSFAKLRQVSPSFAKFCRVSPSVAKFCQAKFRQITPSFTTFCRVAPSFAKEAAPDEPPHQSEVDTKRWGAVARSSARDTLRQSDKQRRGKESAENLDEGFVLSTSPFALTCPCLLGFFSPSVAQARSVWRLGPVSESTCLFFWATNKLSPKAQNLEQLNKSQSECSESQVQNDCPRSAGIQHGTVEDSRACANPNGFLSFPRAQRFWTPPIG